METKEQIKTHKVVKRCPRCRAYLGKRTYRAPSGHSDTQKCSRCREWVEVIETQD